MKNTKQNRIILTVGLIFFSIATVLILIQPYFDIMTKSICLLDTLGLAFILFAIKYDWNYVKADQKLSTSSGLCPSGNNCFNKVLHTGIFSEGNEIIVDLREYKAVSAYHGLWNIYQIPWAGITILEDRKKIRYCWYVAVNQ